MNPYIANTPQDVREMLGVIGVKSIDDLFRDIPSCLAPKSFDLPGGLSEHATVCRLNALALKNTQGLVPFIGGGYYDHYVPAACQAVMSRGEFTTAYTPYQPECAQGTLQALFEFQSSICAITGMDVANASLYEGGTALYEAMMMAIRLTGRRKIVLDEGVNPIYRKLIRSYIHNLDFELVEVPSKGVALDRAAFTSFIDGKTAAVIVQNPNFFGTVEDLADVVKAAHAAGALAVMSVYPIALGILKTPEAMGADIVTGEGQSLGLPLSFGGPYLGFMATRRKFIRQMPGRIVGETVDAQGRRCFVNTLQAREQHIRREKATSNICTNVALCAVQAAVFMALLGRQGFRDLAKLNADKAAFARQEIAGIKGAAVDAASAVFNEFVVRLPRNADDVVEKMIDRGFAAGFPLGRYYPGRGKDLLVSVTEKRTKEEIMDYVKTLRGVLHAG